MSVTENEILHLIHFADMSKWSATASVFDGIKASYPLSQLSKVLKRVKEPINIEDDCLYKRITVRLYGQGVLQRDEVSGKDIGTKRQFVAHAGQLIISRIDARNGAFGIVPNELEGAIVTNDFWLFDVHNALPQYLMLVMSSNLFQKYWQTQSSGTTNRQRVGEDDFLQSKIALPSIEEQKILLAKYNASIKRADRAEAEVHKLCDGIDEYLLNSLGVQINTVHTDNGSLIFISHLRDISRWDMWTQRNTYSARKYRFSKFSSVVCGTPLYGANEKAKKEKSDIRYIRITDIQEDGSLNDEFVSTEKVEDKYILENNDFLIARSGNTVGKTFLYKSEMGKCIFAGYLVKYKLNQDKIIPEYLLEYTKSCIFKSWIKNNQRIFGQPNINGQEYLNADIIVPDIETQKEIVEHISTVRIKTKALREEAESLRQHAKKEFEEAVFGGV